MNDSLNATCTLKPALNMYVSGFMRTQRIHGPSKLEFIPRNIPDSLAELDDILQIHRALSQQCWAISSPANALRPNPQPENTNPKLQCEIQGLQN